jgi:hypothetical protein
MAERAPTGAFWIVDLGGVACNAFDRQAERAQLPYDDNPAKELQAAPLQAWGPKAAFQVKFSPNDGDNRAYSLILVHDYDKRHFVPNGPAEGESAAGSGIEESL